MLPRFKSVVNLWCAVVVCFCFSGYAPVFAADTIPTYGYEIVRAYPHDPRAFTQGLFVKDGFLYESTGRYGQSSLRKVDLETGRIRQFLELPAEMFGEGITCWADTIIGLTWRSGVGFVWALEDFEQRSTFRLEGQGWGLTNDDAYLYLSDGTANIRVLDPDTLQPVRHIAVTANGQPVDKLNELEWVEGEIYANIWYSDKIARIDPSTGQVKGWIDLTGLQTLRPERDAVLNGIAYDGAGRLFVTGKLWPKLFEIRVIEP